MREVGYYFSIVQKLRLSNCILTNINYRLHIQVYAQTDRVMHCYNYKHHTYNDNDNNNEGFNNACDVLQCLPQSTRWHHHW